MLLYYDEIKVKGNVLVEKGVLEIKEKTISIIQGVNGAGKTLLVKKIAKASNCSVAFLDQDNDVTLTDCSVLESIALESSDEKKNEIKQLLKELKLDYLCNLNNKHLSGGERRLVNVLRCIFCDAELLIMDEPTNDLDFKKINMLLEMLKRVKSDKTIIIVSHDDRVLAVSDNVFFLRNNKVSCEKKSVVLEDEEKNANKSELDYQKYTFVRKNFHYNPIKLFIILILILIILLQVNSFKKTVINKNNDYILKDNEIMVLSFYSSEIGYYAFNNVLPIFAVNGLKGLNVREYVNMMHKIDDLKNKKNVEPYPIELKSTDYYVVYPIEFLSKKNGDTINVLEYYKEKYYSNDDVSIETSAYFSTPESQHNGEKIKRDLDIKLYKECLSELESSGDYKICAAMVVLESKFYDALFFEEKEVIELGKHDLLVASNEIRELSHQLSIFREIKNDIIMIIISMIVLLILNLMIMNIILRLIKNKILLLRNYSYDIEKVKKIISEKMNCRLYLIIEVMIFLIGLSWYFKDLPFLQMNFIFHLLFIVYCSLLFDLENFQINKYIEKNYRWDKR